MTIKMPLFLINTAFFSWSVFANTALVVIDMQPYFLERGSKANSTVVAGVISAIQEARSGDQTIIIVEYKPHLLGQTHQDIIQAVSGYNKVITLAKYHNDGSSVIKEELVRQRVTLSELKICGLNTSACLMETINGLQNQMSRDVNFSVLAYACSDSSESDHKKALTRLKKSGLKVETSISFSQTKNRNGKADRKKLKRKLEEALFDQSEAKRQKTQKDIDQFEKTIVPESSEAKKD